jgi:catechol 2,3-dioxygenase-like lactoylglutathione lyase family enzyme
MRERNASIGQDAGRDGRQPGGSVTLDISQAVPVLRVMSVRTALPFYVDYLGFRVDWEHRFEAGSPLYVQVSRSKAVLHLSEHHGDGSPNGVVWIPVADVVALRSELLGRPNAPMRPGLDADAPGGSTLQVIDPYGNVLRFAQPPV